MRALTLQASPRTSGFCHGTARYEKPLWRVNFPVNLPIILTKKLSSMLAINILRFNFPVQSISIIIPWSQFYSSENPIIFFHLWPGVASVDQSPWWLIIHESSMGQKSHDPWDEPPSSHGFFLGEIPLSGWWFGTCFFPIYWECHHPNWRNHLFQRGGPTTKSHMI